MNTIETTEKCAMQVKAHVSGESETASRMKVRSGKFSMIIDEPENMGGTDMGPSPVQVLLMALAGCLNVTGHQVASERGLALKKLKITIDGEMNPCTFMGCSYDERAGFQTIKVMVKPDFDADVSPEAVREWLEETEARCPVTDNIREGTRIVVANG